MPEPVENFIQRWQHQRDDEHDEKRKLKAGFKKLSRFPQQNNERGGGERVDRVARPFQRPAAKDDGHHHRRANGGGFPAGRGGIKPDERNCHDAAPRPRDLQHAQQRDKHPGNQRDAQAVNGKEVHRAGAQKRFADVGGERGAPPERHRPKQVQRLVFRQTQRQRMLRPVQKPVGQRRTGQRRPTQLPAVGGAGFELVKNSARLEVITVIKKSLGQRRCRLADDAGDFNRLTGEKITGEHAWRRHDN